MSRSLSLIASSLTRIIVPLLATLMALALVNQARADEFYVSVSFAAHQKEAVALNLLVGQARVIRFDRPIGRISITNSEVAEAVVVATDQVVVNGKAFGQVNFIVWDKSGEQSMVLDIYVRANLALVDALIHNLFPKDDVLLSQANGSVIISGTVDDPKKVALAESAVQAAGFKTVNMLRAPFKNAPQVQLQVRVAEVNRNRARELGTSYSYQPSVGTGGYLNSGNGPSALTSVDSGNMVGTVSSALNLLIMGKNAMGFIHALQTQGALRSLAEPNLIAMDGQQASFLAGGEFPVPIVQGSGDKANVTIVFKEYGVRLNFKPIISGEDHIRLELEPEISTIDFSNGVKYAGFTIPALRTRRAKTGIELQDGQSFALAGLLDNSETRSLTKVPLLADVPVLGSLFRSTQFQKQETEMMVIVTAQIVKPINPDSLPKMRGVDDIKSGSPLGNTQTGDGLTGKSGYSLDRKADESVPASSVPSPNATSPNVPSSSAPAPNETAPSTPAPNVPSKTSSSPTTTSAPATSAANPDWRAVNFAVIVPSTVIEAAAARTTTIKNSIAISAKNVRP